VADRRHRLQWLTVLLTNVEEEIMTAGVLLAALVVVSVLLLVAFWAVWSAVAAVERSKRHPDRPKPTGPRPERSVHS
jgi:heme/copper-type cytochrome/quinol oxidase subunit 2